tara:strand:+ start:5428 stop:5727 length:300 start_codon:yes stop_codon:yes gene_type:complete
MVRASQTDQRLGIIEVSKLNWDKARLQRAARMGGAAVTTEVRPTPVTALYLAVEFMDKEEAKRLGARWNAQEKRWYVMAGGLKAERLTRRFPVIKSVEV